ncbi:MAG: FIST C-terminal domain-containing protein [Pseudomonadota bacterium]|jgi:small ligand-binding sensory domain FIST
MPIPVASALAVARKPEPELAADAVREALSCCRADIAQSVLLFLSDDFARHTAQAAVQAASRAAHCLQVAGCTAPGVFTDQDWVLDRPAACALVFGANVTLGAPAGGDEPLLTLALPAAATSAWLEGPAQRFGILSTDGAAQNPGRVWGHGKLSPEGRFEATLTGVRAAIGAAQGLRILTPPLAVSQVSGYDVRRLGEQPALATLLRELPLELRSQKQLPLHLLFAGVIVGDPQGAVDQGRYTPVSLITVNGEENSVTLATQLAPGSHLFWGMRSAVAAERDMRVLVSTLAARLQDEPDFGLMFSCMGRGPYFFGGEDRDLAAVKERFPGMPLAGVYGSGEIGHIGGGNRILHNTAVLALFRAHV